MFRRILVPLDGSRRAESALPAALRFARRSRSEIRLLTVIDPELLLGNESGWAFVGADRGDDVHAAAASYLEGVRARLMKLLPGVRTTVCEGFPVDEILGEAEAFEADLLVMATHGREGLPRLLAGSVTAQCAHRARCPVLVVRGDEAGGTPPGSLAIHRVVVPLDGSELAERALGSAVGIAAAFGSEIALVRLVPDPTIMAPEFFPRSTTESEWIFEREELAASDYLEDLAGPLRAWGLAVSVHVARAPATAGGILAEAHGDLIVIATHARTGIKRALLGSVTDAVVRAGVAPVMVIPPRTAPGGARQPGSRPERTLSRKAG